MGVLLPDRQGRVEPHRLGAASRFAAAGPAITVRTAHAAAHGVMDPLRSPTPGGRRPSIGSDGGVAAPVRGLGFGIAEALGDGTASRSLVDQAYDETLRALLPAGVKMYMGDDFDASSSKRRRSSTKRVSYSWPGSTASRPPSPCWAACSRRDSLAHFADVFRLADAAGLLVDPDLAAARMRVLRATQGVG